MNEEQLRRYLKQFRNAAGGSGGRPTPGAMAGGGLLLAGLGASFLLFQSLVTGTRPVPRSCAMLTFHQLRVATVL